VLLGTNTTLESLGSSFGLRRVSCRTLPIFTKMSLTLRILIVNPKDAQKLGVANALNFGPFCDQHRGAFFCLWVVSRRSVTTSTLYTTGNLSALPTSSLTPHVGHSSLMPKNMSDDHREAGENGRSRSVTPRVHSLQSIARLGKR
jgi:hypothetical protein